MSKNSNDLLNVKNIESSNYKKEDNINEINTTNKKTISEINIEIAEETLEQIKQLAMVLKDEVRERKEKREKLMKATKWVAILVVSILIILIGFIIFSEVDNKEQLVTIAKGFMVLFGTNIVGIIIIFVKYSIDNSYLTIYNNTIVEQLKHMRNKGN